MSLIKDRVFQLYKKHILMSDLLKRTKEKLLNKDFIDSTVEILNIEPLVNGLMDTISEHSKWLTRYAKELPGFNKLSLDDFMKMLSSASLLLFGIHSHQFYDNNENVSILINNYQFSKNRMNLVLGAFKTGLLFEFHFNLRRLNLSENEMSLIFPFILTNCNGKFQTKYYYKVHFFLISFLVHQIKDKETLLQLKDYYTKMLIYEFELNGRDENFFDNLNEVFVYFKI